ncbi:DUF4242 domain-containing protein [Halobacteriales archaeon QS_8_65_32]|nr:MAG: DUF4242 domain-containing protein [Halobacteriales archaeon QS_8_65_32]
MANDTTDFLIMRELDDPISYDQLDEAANGSGAALEELRDEGVDIRWVESEVLENDEGQVTGTFCHYQAESEEAIYDHADRAGLPATNVSRQGERLDGE